MKLIYQLVELIVRLVLEFVEVELEAKELTKLMTSVRSAVGKTEQVKALVRGDEVSKAKKKAVEVFNELNINTQINKPITEKSMSNKLDHFYKKGQRLVHDDKEQTAAQVLRLLKSGVKFKFNSKVYSLIKKEAKK